MKLYFSVRLIFFTPVFLLTLSTITGAKTYFVERNHASVSDSNPGTQDLPWKTIGHAAETLVAGDTVLIKDGVYNEQVFTAQNGTASSGPIVFSAYPGEIPIIDGSGVSTGTTGFLISHSYIILTGLEIRNWDTGIWMEIGEQIEISDCEVHHNFFGIGASNGAHDFVLNRVEIHHFNLYGFDASPYEDADCYNGTFNDCSAHSARDREQNVDGFALGHGTQHNFTFNRCIVYDVYDGFDISSRNTTLNRCLAYNCWNGAYKLWQDDIKLVNCVGYDCPSAVVELDWDGEPGKSLLINCTFFHGETFTIWVENQNDTLELYNCIIAGGDNIGLAFEQMGTNNYRGDYNIFHNVNPNRAVVVGYTDEFMLDQVAAGDWTTYSGQDGHSLVAYSDTSLFIDPGNLDLHLQHTSLAVDHGTIHGAPSEDYDGNPRPSGAGYDIGAYEVQSETRVLNPQNGNSPELLMLSQNYPNPFNIQTSIKYHLTKSDLITLKIYNLAGQEIETLIHGFQSAGEHQKKWSVQDLPSGVYFCRLQAGELSKTRKIILYK